LNPWRIGLRERKFPKKKKKISRIINEKKKFKVHQKGFTILPKEYYFRSKTLKLLYHLLLLDFVQISLIPIKFSFPCLNYLAQKKL